MDTPRIHCRWRDSRRTCRWPRCGYCIYIFDRLERPGRSHLRQWLGPAELVHRDRSDGCNSVCHTAYRDGPGRAYCGGYASGGELGIGLDDVTVFHPLQLLPVYSNFAAPFHDIPERHSGPRAWAIKHLFGAFGFVTSAASSTTMDAWLSLRAAPAAGPEMLLEAAVVRTGIPA